MKNWRGAGDPGVRADRLRVRPWTDPRLLIGLVLVLGATVLGARLVAASDDRVEYWSVASDVRVGDRLTADHLRPAAVRLDGDSAERYLRVDDDLPAPIAELQWGRDVPAGTLVDTSALTRADRGAVRQLPLTVTEGSMPTDLRRGDLVEIWVGPGRDEAGSGAAESARVLQDVRVLRTGNDAGSLGGALAQTVLVEVPQARLTGGVVSTVASGHVTVVRVS